MGESGTFDRFGWQIVAGAVEYQATDNLILEGAAGGFWSAKKTGCPAVLRVGSLSGRCGAANNDDVNTPSGDPVYNFTSNSRYLGWEVAGGVRYTIMPGLTWTPRLAYADYGKGLDQNNRKATNAWVLANRMVYIF
jgi:opacity protein-like surface antigen